MKSAVIAFLTCLLVLYVQGQSHNTNKCKCLNGYVGRISTKLIKTVSDIHYPSIYCLQTEIIITTTADEKKCVNPESPLGKTILKNMKQRKNEAVSVTTTSSQTNTQRSTSLHTTSTV